LDLKICILLKSQLLLFAGEFWEHFQTSMWCRIFSLGWPLALGLKYKENVTAAGGVILPRVYGLLFWGSKNVSHCCTGKLGQLS
jgi:hypothetical protein